MIKKKIKPILPSLKEKKRYMVFKIISSKKIAKAIVFESILYSYKENFGDIGLARAGIQLVDYDEETNTGILRVGNTYVDNARYSFAMVKKIDDMDVIIFTKGISGTIKKSKAKFAK